MTKNSITVTVLITAWLFLGFAKAEATSRFQITASSASICGSGSVTLTAEVEGGTITWLHYNKIYGTGHSITVSGAEAVGRWIAIHRAGGCDNSRSNAINITFAPAAPAQPSEIVGNSSVCAGSTQIYSVTNVSGVSYQWQLPTGWVQTDGGTTHSITVTAGTTGGNITVTPSNACGNGNARTTGSITVISFSQNNPVATITCSGIFTLDPTITGGGAGLQIEWQQSPDDGVTPWVPAAGPNGATNYVTSVANGNVLTGSMYFRRVVTSVVCGATLTSASALVTYDRPPLPVFMAYNLGADSAYNTPKLQMQYLADQVTNNQLDASVYGGWFQWGREPMAYAVNSRVSPPLRYSGNGIASRSAALVATATYDANGQIVTNPNGSPGGTNYTLRADTVHVYEVGDLYDWRGRGAAQFPCVDGSQCNSLWGNGQAIGTPTPGGGVLHTNGNYYQEQIKTVNDPCPPGWRVPTQNDWELMGSYDCNPMDAGGSFSVASGIGRPTNGLVWVGVRCSGGTCNINSTWATTTRGGYAIYCASDWNAAGLTASDNLCAASAPEPLLFLPAAGVRNVNGGSHSNVGTRGNYWSSSITGSHGLLLLFDSTTVNPLSNGSRASGFSVRCVAE